MARVIKYTIIQPKTQKFLSNEGEWTQYADYAKLFDTDDDCEVYLVQRGRGVDGQELDIAKMLVHLWDDELVDIEPWGWDWEDYED